jgi:DNA polymerase
VFGTGPLDPDILVLGEAPGSEEDRVGQPFVGLSSKLLNELLAEAGIDRANVYLTHLLKCSSGPRKATATELANCRPYLMEQIALIRPKSIVTLGTSPAQALLSTTESLERLRGRLHDYQGIPVLCTYAPAYLLPGRKPQSRPDVINDLQLLLRYLSSARNDRNGEAAPSMKEATDG